MSDIDLPPVQNLAANYASRALKPILIGFLQLDWRLAQFVSQAKEPILTQMRIAWWRDELSKPAPDRAKGDPILDTLSTDWRGEEQTLINLVNGWEALIADPPLPESAITEFADGRADCFAAMARLVGFDAQENAARACGARWAFADLAARMSDAAEREFVVQKASLLSTNDPVKLPRQLRPFTILDALAARALIRGGGALISGRRDLLVIMRLGLIGR